MGSQAWSFLLIDKRPYVRFHAVQSIVFFLGLQILQAVLGPIFGMGWWVGRGGYWGAFTLGTLLLNLISMVTLVLWILLMLKAFQGVRFKVPLAGNIAESVGPPSSLSVRVSSSLTSGSQHT
jgi:uncharacterized membrane protein